MDLTAFIEIASKYLLIALHSGYMPLAIAIIGFLTIIVFTLKIKPQERAVVAYTKINNRLIKAKENSLFNYRKIYQTLRQSGLLFKYPVLENPSVYIGVKIVLGAIIGLFLSLITWILFPIGFILGYKLIDFYAILNNKLDNQRMQDDIQLIYNSLSVQIKSGVYAPNALCECYELVENLRLKTALLELSGALTLGLPFVESLRKFQKNFDNKYIDSLCITLEQGAESGYSNELLSDISSQIKDFTASQLEKKKAKMDRSMTVCMLIMFSDIMAIVLYLSITNIAASLLTF